MVKQQITKCPQCGQRFRIKSPAAFRCPKCRAKVSPTATGEAQAPKEHQQTIASDSINNQSSESNAREQYLDRFQIHEELGRGGFGTVFKAYDPQLDRTVALKVPTLLLESERRRRRFATEARSAAKLHHPNIVTVYENGKTDDGRLYIASEFVDGATLKTRVEEADSSLTQRVTWVRDLARALSYAHSEGIIHRDIKPENVLIEAASQRPKLADFGLAKVLDDQASGDAQLQTQDGILGTPAFMSPEQARGTLSKVGPHSDQYSLGAVLYQCLTGTPPFRGSTYVVVAAVAGEKEPTPIRKLNSLVPKDLAAICEVAMSKSPSERYSSCGELADDLTCWLDGECVRARPLSQFQRTARLARRHPLPSILVVTTITLLASIAALAASSRSRAIRDRDAVEQQRQAAVEAEKKATALNAQLKSETQRANQVAKAAKESQERAEDLLTQLKEQVAISSQLTTDLETSKDATATEKQRRTAAKEKEDAAVYFSYLQRARAEILENQFGRAQEVLRQAPKPNRHIEFQYLMALASPLQKGFAHAKLPNVQVGAFAFSSDWKTMAYVTSEKKVYVRNATGGKASVEIFPNTNKGFSEAETRIAFFGDRHLIVGTRWDNATIDLSVVKFDRKGIKTRPLHSGVSFKRQAIPDDIEFLYAGSPESKSWSWAYRTEDAKIEAKKRRKVSLDFIDGWPTTWDYNGRRRFVIDPISSEAGFVDRSGKRSGLTYRTNGKPTFATTERNRKVMVGSDRGDLTIYKVGSAEVIGSFNLGPSAVTSGVFDLGLVAATSETSVKVFSLRGNSSEPRSQFDCEGLRFVRMQSFRYGRTRATTKTVFVGVTDNNQFVQIDNGERHHRRTVSRQQVSAQRNSSDFFRDRNGKTLLSAADRFGIRITPQQNSGLKPLTLKGHEARVVAAGLTPDFRRVVSTSSDGTVRVWDTATGLELLLIKIEELRSVTSRSAVELNVETNQFSVKVGRVTHVWGDFRKELQIPALQRTTDQNERK